ncbi:MAG: hypothetical protein KJ558_16350, partial [Gammaproteobacteria bacterium]|nr:hypothetical protein [Gammaproteobacteria bacterium]MBU1656362.1 hypothetical protein [Gammaproteobacteria bacterium]MBU1959708.1 hypothetical protein [Gammaproteobacteria bacterium]
PQPGLGHETLLAALKGLEAEYPGLAITGNYLAGVSTTACIDAALALADRIADRGRAAIDRSQAPAWECIPGRSSVPESARATGIRQLVTLERH